MVRDIVVVGMVGSVVAIAGCNAIVGREPGSLDSAVTQSNESPSAPIPTPAQLLEAADAGAVPTTCGPSSKLCDGRCVDKQDPFFGCGDATCTPCKLDNARAACAGATCVATECAPGYADCNGNLADGCETDLSVASHCGTCNATCVAAAPLCVPSLSGFGCGTGCTASAPTLCGTTCADLSEDAKRCGSCGHACPTPSNGRAKCAAGTCGFACSSGFADCDKVAANGCEVPLLTDSLNCGACGVACVAPATCAAGACK